jgi:hypothetical protein
MWPQTTPSTFFDLGLVRDRFLEARDELDGVLDLVLGVLRQDQ